MKERKITDFKQLASDKNINSDNDSKNNDPIKSILDGKKERSKTHIFKGYYLEREVANTIDRETDGKPKGTKSEFVNEILKKYLKSEGFMK